MELTESPSLTYAFEGAMMPFFPVGSPEDSSWATYIGTRCTNAAAHLAWSKGQTKNPTGGN